MTPVPMRAADFIATVGVNAHINDQNSSYASSNVLAQLQYLGISNLRVSDSSGSQLSEYLALGAAGIKFDAVTVIAPQNPINLANEIADLNQIAPYLKSIEGPNEINTDPVTYNGLTGAAAADAFQAALYNAVRADGALAGAQVLPFSLSVGGSLTGFGNENAYATEANIHGYASGGVPPYYYLSYAVSSVPTVTGKPVVMSETGYYTLQDGKSGVTQYVQGIWYVDILLQDAANGIVNTYLYQLEDGYHDQPNNPEDNYGLYTVDGTPKQAAVDIHNLTTILADNAGNASSFTPATLNYTVTGLNPDYGFQSLFAKSGGVFDIALWSEPQFYNAATGVQSAVTPSQVTVSLGSNANVAVYDVVTGTTAVQTATGVNSVTVALGTDPLIVQVTPIGSGAAAPPSSGSSAPAPAPEPVSAPTPAPPATPVSAPVVLGSGPDTLALQMSEDAYNGNAQFTVAVNGQQIGGVQTVTASHAAGASETFDVLGNFSSGKQTATVTFLNDDYGGSAAQDRNLYVNSATINGQTVTGSSLAIDFDGPDSFQFSPTPASAAPPAPVVAPAPVPPTPVVPPAPSVTVGSGNSTLALSVSEDAFGGNAQFTVSVDGKQIGGTLTATALHNTGASQTFNVLGTFAVGKHIATVTFLNDNYGGSPALDRNLYVTAASINGSAVSGVALNEDYNGPGNFAFVVPAPTH